MAMLSFYVVVVGAGHIWYDEGWHLADEVVEKHAFMLE